MSLRDAHPLTAPAGEPCDDVALQEREQERSAGIAAISTPAANGPQCLPYCWSMYWYSPSGSVCLSDVWRMTLAITNSLSVEDERDQRDHGQHGVARGRMMPQKICAGVAPSTRADSSSSEGIVSKKPFISQVFTPMAPPR